MTDPYPTQPGPGTCALYSLRRATRTVTRVYERAMKDAALGANQFSILAALAQTGPKPLSVLAAGMGMDRTTLSRDLQPLTRRGFVATAADPNDARTKIVALTPEGEAAYAAALPLWRQAQAVVFGALGPGDWVETLKHLATLDIERDTP